MCVLNDYFTQINTEGDKCMRVTHAKMVLTAIILSFLGISSAFADRQLGRDEILLIFQQLTTQPQKTWIAAGTITATHQEYKAPKITDQNELRKQITQKVKDYQNEQNKAELTEEMQKLKLDAMPFNVRYKLANESLMETTETVKYDGNRFYWEINVVSRTDSVKPDEKLSDNYMTDNFDLRWNAKRIFAWDGQNYTTYSLPGNQATVDSTSSMPLAINGPLTAGIVPWGYGYFKYDNLVEISFSAVETYVDGIVQVNLTLNLPNGWVMVLTMNPQKAYALISSSTKVSQNSVIYKQYSNYQLVSGKWIPAIIIIEEYLDGSISSRDTWNITHIDTKALSSYDFSINYQDDSIIEHKAPVSNSSELYWHSNAIDTTALLAKRLDFEANTQGRRTELRYCSNGLCR